MQMCIVCIGRGCNSERSVRSRLTSSSTFCAFNLFLFIYERFEYVRIKGIGRGLTASHKHSAVQCGVWNTIYIYIYIAFHQFELITCAHQNTKLNAHETQTRRRCRSLFISHSLLLSLCVHCIDFAGSRKFVTSHCEYATRTLLKNFMQRKSNWLVDNWQYGFCVPYIHVSRSARKTVSVRGVPASDFDLYISRFIWSFNYGEMWRGHTRVTLCLPIGENAFAHSQPHEIAFSAQWSNWKKAKIGHFHCSIDGEHMVNASDRARAHTLIQRIHFEILSMHFTMRANLFIWLFVRCAWNCNGLDWAVNDRRSASIWWMKMVCGMRCEQQKSLQVRTVCAGKASKIAENAFDEHN